MSEIIEDKNNLFYSDPILFLSNGISEYGDSFWVETNGRKFFFTVDNQLVRSMLTTPSSFHIAKGLHDLKIDLGVGLLTTDGELHKEQRKVLNHVFAPVNIKKQYSKIKDTFERFFFTHRQSSLIEFAMKSTLRALCEVVEDKGIQNVESELILCMSKLGGREALNRDDVEDSVYREKLDEIIYDFLRTPSRKSANSLSEILTAFWERYDIPSGEIVKYVRDGVLTVLLAGHETTANVLATLIYLLERQEHNFLEDFKKTIRAEEMSFEKFVDEKMSASQINYFVKEALRLYPPVWLTGRECTVDFQCGDIKLPEGTFIVTAQYLVQRHQAYFEDPNHFDIGRWSVAKEKEYKMDFKYFPFGGGHKKCIGEFLSMSEILIFLYCLYRNYDVHLSGDNEINYDFGITMRLKSRHYIELKKI